MDHPTDNVLLRFLLGEPSRQESRQVVRHLLSRCPDCAAALKTLSQQPPLGPPPSPIDYQEALDRFAARLREAEGAGRSRNGFSW